jgi:hypothetical protein
VGLRARFTLQAAIRGSNYGPDLIRRGRVAKHAVFRYLCEKIRQAFPVSNHAYKTASPVGRGILRVGLKHRNGISKCTKSFAVICY